MGRSYDIATGQWEGRAPHIGPLQCGLYVRVYVCVCVLRVCVCVFALSVCVHISFLLNKIWKLLAKKSYTQQQGTESLTKRGKEGV